MIKKLLPLILLLCASPCWAAISALTTPPNIATDYAGWVAWMEARIAEFETHCPLTRTTTYYVSATDGNDSDSGLTAALAFATINKAVTVANASGGDVAFLFECGNTWREATNANITVSNVTFSNYVGDNGTALPIFTHFTHQYLDASNVWTNAANNRWTVSEANDICFVKRAATMRQCLERTTSSANCEATSNSFYIDTTGDVLHVNLGGVDPNTVDLEAVSSNTDHGVCFNLDGCRAEGIVALGHGSHRTTSGTQVQPFTNKSTGLNANLFKNCHGFFSNTHAMAHNTSAASGGCSMWLACTAGCSCHPIGAAATNNPSIFNTYTNSGGQETWFIRCLAYGGAPTEVSGTDPVDGIGFLNHTDGNDTGMAVAYDCHTPAGAQKQCTILTNFSNMPAIVADDLTDCHSFTVRCTRPPTVSAHDANIGPWNSRGVVYGCYYNCRTDTNPNYLDNVRPSNAYVLNTIIDCDMQDDGNSTFRGVVGSSGTTEICFVNSWLNFRNWTTSAGSSAFLFEHNVGTGSPPGTIAPDARFINSLLTFSSSGNGKYLGLNNISDATRFTDNAFINATTQTDVRGYSNDVNAVTLTSVPTYRTSHAQLLQAGSATAFPLSHDMHGKARTVATPDIGPVDFSSPAPTDEYLIVQ